MGGDAMYPKKRPKTDREKFYEAFGKKVGCKPEQYLRRKLAGGMPEDELRRLYDMLAVEIAMKARCTALKIAWSPHPGHQRTSWSLLKSAGVYL